MRRSVVLVLASALCAVSSAIAEDVLVLTNGREARGRIVEETDAGVKLDIGVGKMFYPRAQIAEVRRGAPDATPAATAPAPQADDAREESALLYDDGRRVGTRTFRVARTPEGFRFEEEVVFLDAKGAPEMEVRTTERSDDGFRPLAFQVREGSGDASHRMTVGEVRGGRLYLNVSKDGEKALSDEALPRDARFPFAARELFLRESKALGGKLDAKVFDTRDRRWRPTSYSELGTKPLVEDGKALDVRVVLRTRGDVAEREWLDGTLVAHMAEINGEALRAIVTSPDVVLRLKRGDADRVTGKDSAARTRYADPERGFSIGKPDPSWTFEEPAVRGAGALLVVRNVPLFASVDVLRDATAPTDVTLERAAESLQRLCRSIADDFRVTKDGYTGEGAARTYFLEASATTKGEKTRTLARVVVRNGKVWRLLAACPEGAFEGLRAEFEKILESFAVE
jgi:hypothetical protein